MELKEVRLFREWVYGIAATKLAAYFCNLWNGKALGHLQKAKLGSCKVDFSAQIKVAALDVFTLDVGSEI